MDSLDLPENSSLLSFAIFLVCNYILAWFDFTFNGILYQILSNLILRFSQSYISWNSHKRYQGVPWQGAGDSCTYAYVASDRLNAKKRILLCCLWLIDTVTSPFLSNHFKKYSAIRKSSKRDRGGGDARSTLTTE